MEHATPGFVRNGVQRDADSRREGTVDGGHEINRVSGVKCLSMILCAQLLKVLLAYSGWNVLQFSSE